VFILVSRTAVLITIATMAAAQSGGLRIEIIEGNGAINNVRSRTARQPVVRVSDADGAPVAGAVVTFILPAIGASGTFADGDKVLSMRTDEDGRAVASGLRPNTVVGQFQIRVNAVHDGRNASAVIVQTNASPAEGGSARSKKLIILGLIAGGVVGGVAAAVGGGGGNGTPSPQPSDPPTTGTITPGTPGIGPPR
jgi:hypothetical protein